jgi:hypothetical protein
MLRAEIVKFYFKVLIVSPFCLCRRNVCTIRKPLPPTSALTYTHTHIHIYIDIYRVSPKISVKGNRKIDDKKKINYIGL